MTAPFKRIRSVTLPVLKMVPGKARYLIFLGPMALGKKIDDKKEPATLARCLDMETGEEGQLICAAVVQKEMNENFPNDAYVGRGFEITYTRVAEKKYNIPSISEVSIPEEMQPAVDALMKVQPMRKAPPPPSVVGARK